MESIKPDQSGFIQGFNKKLEEMKLPGTSLPADMAMSPAAGGFSITVN
jgi:hypothetical protein